MRFRSQGGKVRIFLTEEGKIQVFVNFVSSQNSCVFRSRTKMNRWDGFSTIRVSRSLNESMGWIFNDSGKSELRQMTENNVLVALEHWAFVIEFQD